MQAAAIRRFDPEARLARHLTKPTLDREYEVDPAQLDAMWHSMDDGSLSNPDHENRLFAVMTDGRDDFSDWFLFNEFLSQTKTVY